MRAILNSIKDPVNPLESSASGRQLIVGGQDVGDAPRDETGRSLTACS